ncbi:hypothetical protein GCM10012280_65480 [Wenjunlia tyrosinilytica]|uniref:Uncharacterized protein n=1 Tax=Wenjunlia tyrosinilytica TaxID=1544741 RepID=A0A917ZWM5_9ACTN|nr:hypothetical protein GCM10012280_65480 [Wenjunlia tyrosinilytica]
MARTPPRLTLLPTTSRGTGPPEGGRASQNGFATKTYPDGDVFTGVLKVAAPFPVEINLGQI